MQWNCVLFVCRREKYEVLAHQSKMPFQHGCIEQLGLATNCGELARDKNKCSFFPSIRLTLVRTVTVHVTCA